MNGTISSHRGTLKLRRTFMETLVLGIFHLYSFFVKIIQPVLALLAMPTVKNLVEKKLKRAGVGVNGEAPGDLKVLNDEAYLKFLLEGDLGAVESVMRGYIEYDGVKTFEKIFEQKKFHSLVHPLYHLLAKTQLQIPMKTWSSGEQPGNLIKVKYSHLNIGKIYIHVPNYFKR